MRSIPLTRGHVAVVDDADYEAVRAFKWHAAERRFVTYAARDTRKSEGTKTVQLLHHFLLGKIRVDHRDGNGLNNCRENLRPATKSQNAQAFQNKAEGKSSGFRGVAWCPRDKKWRAQIKVSGKFKSLGYFSDETQAARAYDVAARKYFGEFAAPNFPS